MHSHRIVLTALVLLILVTVTLPTVAQDNVVLVIIDGARYTETFGDPDREHIPVLDSLAQHGTVLDRFYNDEYTYTSRAVPALWCGVWTDVRDTTWNNQGTQYTLQPSVFEYVRHDLNLPADDVYYVLKSLNSLWLPSFHPDYGPDYWPTFHSEGYSDENVLDEALDVLQTHHPRLTLVYFADVDHAGHSGDWDDYLDAIETVDGLVGQLWDFLETDPVYAGDTVMMITNDHGRHDDAHGGFQGHGDDCDGCRHIMMFAIGEGIGQGVIDDSEYRTIPDFAVTACEILDVNPSQSSGDVLYELFAPNSFDEENQAPLPAHYSVGEVYPNPFNAAARVTVDLAVRTTLRLDLFDPLGRRIDRLASGTFSSGRHTFAVSGMGLSSGTYFVRSIVGGQVARIQRITLIK